jgi:two-component system KDP operon response regulator KdpE
MQNILLVEDDDAVRALVSRKLERHGYVVRAAPNPLEAIASIKEWRPALLIMDMNLPLLHGLELVHLLRGNSLGIPAIAITGAPLDEDMAQAAGFLKVLYKPFGLDELLQAVQDVLS